MNAKGTGIAFGTTPGTKTILVHLNRLEKRVPELLKEGRVAHGTPEEAKVVRRLGRVLLAIDTLNAIVRGEI